LSATVAEQNLLIKELVTEIRQRDAETLKTLRQIADSLAVSLSTVSQTLAGRPVPMPLVDYHDEPEDEEPADTQAKAEAPEKSAAEKMKAILEMGPELFKVITFVKSMMGDDTKGEPAPTPQTNGAADPSVPFAPFGG
jgi:hypothetical protein